MTTTTPTTTRSGFQAPAREFHDPIVIPVTGSKPLPAWLGGVLYRMGPSKFDVGKVKIRHWFDGMTLVHRFEIKQGGVVEYRSRGVSKDIEAEITKNQSYSGFGPADPCKSVFLRAASAFKQVAFPSAPTSALDRPVNINVTVTPTHRVVPIGAAPKHGADEWHLIGKTDYGQLQLLDAETLEPVPSGSTHVGYDDPAEVRSRFNYRDINAEFIGQLSAAHHQSDPATGDHYNVTVDPAGQAPTLRVMHINEHTGASRVLATVSLRCAAYIHSFALTKSYVVLIEQPYYLGWYGAKALLAASYVDALEWNPAMPTRMYLVDRVTGSVVTTVDSDTPFFYFHTVNAWDIAGADGKPTAVVLDVCAADMPGAVRKLAVDSMCPALRGSTGGGMTIADNELAAIRRYTIPVSASVDSGSPAVVTYKQVSKPGAELPRIHAGRAMTPTRYVYAMLTSRSSQDGDGGQDTLFGAIAKIDTADGGSERKWSAPNAYPGEPVFVPRPNGTNEDDGVVLSVVLDAVTETSFLLVLDASDFTEISRAQVPVAVPFGFHGSFLGAQASMHSFT
ncbi:carotenoid oxygenase [Blastocladiella britannica]|nr:carotenoid oxygenase [Blastocladiella britannica]